MATTFDSAQTVDRPVSGGVDGAPPNPPPTASGDPPDNTDDRELLLAFVSTLRGTLDWLVHADGWLPADLPYSQAWEATQPAFDLVVAQLAQPGIYPTLSQSGLTGDSLRLKVGLFDLAMRQTAEALGYEEPAELIEERPSRREFRKSAGRFWRKALGLLSTGLGIANDIGSSLLKLPGVEVVDEFKKTVEAGKAIIDGET